ncbi:MAG: SRPBCC family protein [Jatrophihabitantaceae bacterium]
MADFLANTDVAAPADELFEYLSQVENLPHYFERMTSVTDNEDGTISVSADLGDRVVEGEAWFEVDHAARTLSWGSEGPNDYSGQLQVTGDATGSVVEVTLRTERPGDDEIQEGLEKTVAVIKLIMESR